MRSLEVLLVGTHTTPVWQQTNLQSVRKSEKDELLTLSIIRCHLVSGDLQAPRRKKKQTLTSSISH